MPDAIVVVVEVVGEGKTDVGRTAGIAPEIPVAGVVPILLARLCGDPASLRVRRRPLQFLQGKSLGQKVHFAKRQAFYNGSAAVAFVVDTEGDHPGPFAESRRGRDLALPEFPCAVGVAHPCVEAWLLADARAIADGLGLPAPPEVPDEPERLPAPCRDREGNPKRVLGRCSGRDRPLSADDTTRIARGLRDLDRLRGRCPLGFAPFADEVGRRIRPLFD